MNSKLSQFLLSQSQTITVLGYRKQGIPKAKIHEQKRAQLLTCLYISDLFLVFSRVLLLTVTAILLTSALLLAVATRAYFIVLEAVNTHRFQQAEVLTERREQKEVQVVTLGQPKSRCPADNACQTRQ